DADLEAPELGRTSDLLRGLFHPADALGRELRCEGEAVPAVPAGHGPAEGGRRVAADDELRSAFLDRSRVGVDAGEVDERTVVFDRTGLCPHGAHGVDVVVGAAA